MDTNIQSRDMLTSESKRRAHPDEFANELAARVVREALRITPDARVDVQVLVTRGFQGTLFNLDRGVEKSLPSGYYAIFGGQVTLPGGRKEDLEQRIPTIVQDLLLESGYGQLPEFYVMSQLIGQSDDIGQGVSGEELGAGDQGIAYGYAISETPERIMLAHKMSRTLVHGLDRLLEAEEVPGLRPDGKSLATVEYDINGKPLRISNITIAAQHEDMADREYGDFLKELRERLITEAVLGEAVNLVDSETKILINGTGRFVRGFLDADSGVRGRTFVINHSGATQRHGGGSFHGKDYTKWDVQGPLICRYIAKTVVEAGLAEFCEVNIAYTIGQHEPTSFALKTEGTGILSDRALAELVFPHFDLSPGAIVEKFSLKDPEIYVRIAQEGLYGIADYPWEQVDEGIVTALRDAVAKN